MRCARCRKEISGIGKPAVPPVLPAAIAFAGSIWGLFNLTLGQDPSNALPHWSPAFGWSATLGSLALASVLIWIGLVRRKCPDCGSTRMLDAMEEEGLLASERLAAQKAAVDEALVGLGKKAPGASERDLRAQVEAEVRAAQAKENADRLAALEQELRADLEKRVRAEHERQSAENERVLRQKLEGELRAQLETKLRSEGEKQLRASPSVTSPAAAKPVTPPPVSTAKALAASIAPAGKPVTHPLVAPAKAVGSGAAPQNVAPTPASQAAETATPGPGETSRTAQPAAPHAEVETAPLALKASAARATVPSPAPSGSGPTPPPQTLQPEIDGHERAKRRARVILSDLSVYHRDELLKAARASDPRKELGTLWRDAVISYQEVAPPEIRSVTNYLEEELTRYLVRLRST